MKSHMDLTRITDDCLERLARGESIADCLALYPEAAEELGPILSAAEQLAAFSQARLTEGQRLRAKVALREELAVQRAQRERSRHALGIVSWARLRVAPLAVMVALLLFVTVAFTTVAASQPGDFAYPVRVAVERAPALVQTNPARRAAAELAAADRRLSDVTRHQDRGYAALAALLSSDEAAVQRAAGLSEAERERVAARVAGHAEALLRLAARAGDPEVAELLRTAASRAQLLAGGPAGEVNRLVSTPTVLPSATRPVATSTPRPGAAVTVVLPTVVVVKTPTPVAPPVVVPLPTGAVQTPAATVTLRPRPRLSVTPPAGMTLTPGGPGIGEGTPRPHATLRPRATLSVVPPILTPRQRPTLPMPPVTPVIPTVPPTPIVVLPTLWFTPEVPTATPGQASFDTPTPTVWWMPPTPTLVVPTLVVPTLTPRPVLTRVPTATVIWATFTPAPTATSRPDIRATLTATVEVPVRPTQGSTPAPTQTPRRQRTDTPTPSDAGGAPATPTPIQPTATSEVTPPVTR